MQNGVGDTRSSENMSAAAVNDRSPPESKPKPLFPTIGKPGNNVNPTHGQIIWDLSGPVAPRPRQIAA